MTYLLLQLLPTLLLSVRREDAPERIVVVGASLVEVRVKDDGGLFLGFYDWLRTSAGRVIGVDLTFHDGREIVQEALLGAGVGTWLTPDIFRVVFDQQGEIDDEASVDQEFSVSRCYLGPEGQVALLFDASELTKEDISALTS